MSQKEKNLLFISNNNLTIKIPSQKKPIPIKGKFKVNKNNEFIYLVNEPANWRKQYNLPHKIILRGKWKLDDNHNLILDLYKKHNFEKKILSLNGRILDVSNNQLSFQLKSKGADNKDILYDLKLKGIWRADKLNRLVFEVTKKDKPDILVLKGVWGINKNNKITYTYKKKNLVRKNIITNNFIFDGHWQIDKRNRIRYIVSKDNKSFFDFKVQLESPSLYPQKGIIKYRLGIGAKNDRKEKILSLYGKWNFSRKLGLSFDIDYGNGKIKSIYFKTTVNMTPKDKLIFSLRDKNDKIMGISLTFKHKFLSNRDAEYFIKLKNQGNDSYVGAGFTFCF